MREREGRRVARAYREGEHTLIFSMVSLKDFHNLSQHFFRYRFQHQVVPDPAFVIILLRSFE